ncbi:hypothetical protein CQ12_10295 [Bradyrhizobium jicamae]|uniref:Uncharacterized protein n=2 Tax=Bradyrhizobium jicamae TaxID=280332 RepID=A0A0R3LXL7_9BRAD|nr:hypothetical protein CQ12_10295 [Bradyrhizobium jicamae]
MIVLIGADRIRALSVQLVPARRTAMWALETLAIYLTPFLIIGIAVKLLMKRSAVDLADVQKQAGTKRRPRKVFLLGGWRTED